VSLDATAATHTVEMYASAKITPHLYTADGILEQVRISIITLQFADD